MADTTPSPEAGRAPEIPDIKKPDIQMLLQDNAQLRRDHYEEVRRGDRRVAEERERARWEGDRIRADFQTRLSQAERENDALITALGRLREENDRLREENCVLKLPRANGHQEKEPERAPEPAAAAPVPTMKRSQVSIIPSASPLFAKPIPLMEPPQK